MAKTLPLNRQDGFTLVEALMAMFVLGIGISVMYSMQMTSIRGNSHSMSITSASNMGMEKIEDIINTPYDELEDLNKDGEDGINEISSPDYSEDSDDGNYTLMINVVDDKPVAGCKLVQVLVRDNLKQMNNTVTLQYFKEESI